MGFMPHLTWLNFFIKEIPDEIWHSKLQEVRRYASGKDLSCNILTFCLGHEVVCEKIRGQEEEVEKPSSIDTYNGYMGGVGLTDQYNSYYENFCTTFENFCMKNNKVVEENVFWMVELLVTNSCCIKCPLESKLVCWNTVANPWKI